MKKIFGLLCVLQFFSPELAHTKGHRVSLTWDVGCFTNYVYGQSGETIHDKPVLQQAFGLTDKSGVYGKLFFSVGLQKGVNADPGNDGGVLVGINRDLSDSVNFDFGYAGYRSYDPDGEGDQDFVSMNLTFQTIRKVEMYGSGEVDLQTQATTLQGGLRSGISILGREVDLDLSVGAGTESGRINYSRIGVATTFVINPTMSITPQINFQKKIGGFQSSVEDKIWGGVSFMFQ